MKKELNILLTAFMFYTRINVSKWVKYKPENMNLAIKYLPLVGVFVGGLSAGIYVLSTLFLSPLAAVVMSLITGVLITGAFHEDGFADTCDGFGGGWEKNKILSIMKDSRIGTYGAVGLILLFFFKTSVISDVYFLKYWPFILLITISAHTLSRFTAATFVFTHAYVRDTDSKSKEATSKTNISVLLIAASITIIPLVFTAYYTNTYSLLLAIIPVYLTKVLLGVYFKKWIGGYTGDTLGATQQITEMIYYLSVLAIWKFI